VRNVFSGTANRDNNLARLLNGLLRSKFSSAAAAAVGSRLVIND
jgi:hypothetical protein